MYRMDETDYAILELLKTDGRMSYSDIAEEVHLSRVAVRERISAMKNNGIIQGFTVIIDAKAYNKMAGIFIDVEVEPSKLDKVAKTLMENPDIAIVAQHTGAAGLHVHAYISSIEKLSEFLEEQIYSIDGVKGANASPLIRQYKTTAWIARY
ncbi:MAG TPA: Lrp/AsnC family transcriptional regulator [Candidatus Scatomorpha gallistercoris]|nr:Lrp/AsnC family transcriptional regulator [Candidatus Scatomorpha gallistercoris]